MTMQRIGLRLISLVIVSLWCWTAAAQVYPNIPANTVLGRLGSGNPGPPQAIPFATFGAVAGYGNVFGPLTSTVGQLATWANTNGTLLASNNWGGNVTNAQTGTSYTILTTDNGKLVTSDNTAAATWSLPAASTTGFSPFSLYVRNKNTGPLFINAAAGTINGYMQFQLSQYQSAYIVSDGTNWKAFNSPANLSSSAIVDQTMFGYTTTTVGPAITMSGTVTLGETVSVAVLSQTFSYTFLTNNASELGTAAQSIISQFKANSAVKAAIGDIAALAVAVQSPSTVWTLYFNMNIANAATTFTATSSVHVTLSPSSSTTSSGLEAGSFLGCGRGNIYAGRQPLGGDRLCGIFASGETTGNSLDSFDVQPIYGSLLWQIVDPTPGVAEGALITSAGLQVYNTRGAWGAGSAVFNTGAFLVNANTATASTPLAGTVEQINGIDTAPAYYSADAYGAHAAGLIARSAAGTGAAPTAIASGTSFGVVTFGAFNGTGYNYPVGIVGQAAENQGTANGGARLLFFSTPTGGVALTEGMRLQESGALTVGYTTAAPVGTIGALTGFRVNNGATSGHVLRGNGTNFVDAALACADLSVPCLTGNQTITLSGDVTGSGTTTILTVIGNIPTGVTMGGSLLATEIAAPGTPSAGKVSLWVDSTDARFHDKNPAGTIGTTVVAITCTNQFVSAISTAGVPTCATPTAGEISLTNTHILVGNGSAIATDVAVSGDLTLANTGAFTIVANAVTLAKLATQATNTILGNATSGSAVPTALTIGTCSTAASALIWTTNTGFGCNTSITANAVPAANLTGSTLASGVTGSSLTSLGIITSLTATTINAFTLGGTVAGGGNQINNVIIGTGTPLAGFFTTLSATTSLTSPIHYGGSAAGSSLTLASTSGTGTTDKIVLQTGSQVARQTIDTGGKVSFGPNAPTASNTPFVDINQNASTTEDSNFTGAMLRLLNANGTSTALQMENFGSIGNAINGYAAGGTRATPTASTASMSFFVLGGYGFTNAVYLSTYINMQPAETFSATAGGSFIDFVTTPLTTVASARALRIQGSGGLSIGTTTDPGIGSLQINAQAFIPNATSDSGLTDSTACLRTSTGQILKGSGTLGICLGTSGRQFKTAFAPLEVNLDQAMALPLMKYRYKPGYGDDGAREQYGLVAQDVAKVFPDLVNYDSTGEAINYDSGAMLFVSIRWIQELKTDNDNIHAELHELQRKVAR